MEANARIAAPVRHSDGGGGISTLPTTHTSFFDQLNRCRYSTSWIWSPCPPPVALPHLRGGPSPLILAWRWCGGDGRSGTNPATSLVTRHPQKKQPEHAREHDGGGYFIRPAREDLRDDRIPQRAPRCLTRSRGLSCFMIGRVSGALLDGLQCPATGGRHITHHPITITSTVTAAVNTGIMITLLCLDIGCGWTAACLL